MFDSIPSADLCSISKKEVFHPLECFLRCKQKVTHNYKSQSATPKISLKKRNKTHTQTMSKKLKSFQQKSLNNRKDQKQNLQSKKMIFEGRFQGVFDGEFKGMFQGKFYTQDKQNKNRTQTNSRIVCKTQCNDQQLYPLRNQSRIVTQTYKQLKDVSLQNFKTPTFVQDAFKMGSQFNPSYFKTHKHSQTIKLEPPMVQKQVTYYVTPDSRDTYRQKSSADCSINKVSEAKIVTNQQPYMISASPIQSRKIVLNDKQARVNGQRQNQYIKSRISNDSLSIRDENTFRMTDQAQRRFKNQISKYQRIKTAEIDQQNGAMQQQYPRFTDSIIGSTPHKTRQYSYSKGNSSIYPNVASFYQKKSSPFFQQPSYLDMREQISQTSFYGQKLRTNKNILKRRDQIKQKSESSSEKTDENRTQMLLAKKKPMVSIAKIQISSDKNVNEYQAMETNSRKQSKVKTTPIYTPYYQQVSLQNSNDSKLNKMKAIKTLTQFIDEDVQSFLGSNDNHSDMRNSKVIFSHKKLNANLARLLMLSERDNNSNANITSQRQMNKTPHTDFQLVSLKLLKNDINFIQDPNGSIREEAQRDEGV